MGNDDGGSELLNRVQVVDGASLHFRDYGQARHDNWDIEWEATPAPVGRSATPLKPAPEPELAPPARPPKPPAPAPAEKKRAVPKVLPDPVYVPVFDATPPAARRQELEELDEDALEVMEEEAETFPPLADPAPAPVHQLHPPGVLKPGTGDTAPTWDPPAPRAEAPRPPEPGGYVVPTGIGAPPTEPGGHELPTEFGGRKPSQAGAQAIDALPVVFEGVSPKAVEAAVEHFEVFEVKAGTRLISAGEKHPALIMVLGGELSAERNGMRRKANEGDALGFTTLFGDGLWATTVRALVPSRLLVLDLEGFRALRAEGSVVSVAIEEYALNLLMDGLDRARQRVGQLSTGRPMQDFVPKQRFFEILTDAIGMGGIMGARCNAVKALQKSPLFRNAEVRHLEGIGERMEAIKAQAGSFFLKQGEANTSMYLVVSGQVDVITASREDRAVRHESLGPGELFGLWAMLRDHPSRTTVLASSKCLLLELDKLAWAELAPAHTGTGSVLRLAVLRALTSRLVRESARLASLEAGHAPDVLATQSGSFMTINPIDRR